MKTEVINELIPANKDRTVLIKKRDEGDFHIRLHRITVLPGDPLHPIHNSWVQIYDLPTWLKMQKMKEAKISVDWMKASLVNSFEVVHDPRLNNNVNNK